MTEKLFEEDQYLKECTAKVVKVNGKEIVLDKTVLFAFSGGQESDSGKVNGVEIVDSRKDGEEIVHVFENEVSFKEGDEVTVELDWEKRFKLMKLHSLAHIVYYFALEELGEESTIGSNVSSNKARVDWATNLNVNEFLPKIQEKVNAFLKEGHEIKTYADESGTGKRWWELGEWKMPCGGTHVKNTDEIGSCRLKRNNIGAGKERIEVYLE